MLQTPPLRDLALQLQLRRDVKGAPTVMRLLQPNVPLADHPLFSTDVRQGKMLEALRITKLDPALLSKLDAGQKALEAWNDFDWDKAVAQQVLTPAQRDDLFFTIELSRLTGEQYALIDAARKAAVNNTNDLVKWDQAQWLELIRKTSPALSDGLTPEAYAASLAKTVQRTFPSQYFAARIADKTVAERLPRAWNDVAQLLPSNPDLLETLDATDVDWTVIHAAQQPALADRLREAAALVGMYRHLGVGDVLGDTTRSPAEKSAEIGRRIDAMGNFLQINAAEDLRFLNLLEPPAVASTDGDGHADWSGIAPADQTFVRDQLLAYQRVLHLAPDHDTATALLRAGLDSSAAIANLGYRAFKRQTGLEDANAAPAYRAAMHNAVQIANGIQLQKDAVSSLEQGRYFQGIDPSFVNDLKDLPGYADLFGNTSYCDCEDCHSIFSPAAYFTDLMYFIEKNITKPAFGGKKTHPLRLNMRRPDLWHLPLTCDNTNTLIPHLTLVIEMLESYLERTLSIQHVPQTLRRGPQRDRAALSHPPGQRARVSARLEDRTHARLRGPARSARCACQGDAPSFRRRVDRARHRGAARRRLDQVCLGRSHADGCGGFRALHRADAG